MTVRTATLTVIAMVAFAANTLLCRLALAGELIDAAGFMAVRTASGAAMLLLIVMPQWRRRGRPPGDWRAAGMLALYMVGFSFAYLSVGVGTGAVIFFGVVQLTMFVAAVIAGERFPLPSWAGLALAGSGLVCLVSPGITAPDPLGAGLMVIAGVAWGFYSLLGRGAARPADATANNFLLAVPLVIIAALPFAGDAHVTEPGLKLAVASGAVASGLGYVLWYAALRGLSSSQAATVQLSVPVLAALGGVVLLTEPITLRLLLGGAATLGGIAIVLAQRASAAAPAPIESGDRR